MKKHIYKLLVLCAVALFGASCEDTAELTTLQAVSFTSAVEASPSTIVISDDNASESVVTLSWPAVVYPIQAPVTYALQFDIPADTTGEKAWNKAIRIIVGEDVLSKSILGIDLNKMAITLGLPIDVAGKIAVRVESTMDRTIYSAPVVLTVTPYEKPVVFGAIYMPGSYQGEWNVDTAAALSAIDAGVYQGYVTIPVGTGLGFKLNQERNWAQFYGAGASNFDLKNMSDTDFQMPGAGSYQITANLKTLKWSSVPYAWGIVGDATHAATPEDANYGWNNSIPMSYDHVNKVWKITADLIPGNVKFRLNNAWTINYGAKNNTDGIMYLDNSGAYYVGEAGTYEITFTINDVNPAVNGYPVTATYTVTKL
ncbi:SusE domain-containing protein [Flavobacterium sp. N3904]|uniref:SusE domain-containing protein n=1 Tax=Flavobacterium sp. N3904 TaxID=2986835 RepID=UPI002223F779|nr:SusE domain-containing protein [Flavobacterium sp. N3904]